MWETFDALNLSAYRPRPSRSSKKEEEEEEEEEEARDARGEEGKKQREGEEEEKEVYVYGERTDIVFQIGIRGIGLLGSK